MMSPDKFAVCCLALLGVFVGSAQAGLLTGEETTDWSDVIMSVRTDKEVYWLGQTLHATWEISNLGESSIYLGILSVGFVTRRGDEVFERTGVVFIPTLGILSPSETLASNLDIPLPPIRDWGFPGYLHGEYTLTCTPGGASYDGPLEPVSTPFSIVPVPEPASIALLLVGGGLLLRRKRDRTCFLCGMGVNV